MPGTYKPSSIYQRLLINSLQTKHEISALYNLEVLSELSIDLNYEERIYTSPLDVFPQTYNTFRPLDLAIEFGNLTVLNKMIEMGVEFDYQTENLSPLHRAQIFQKRDVIEILLKHAPKLCFSCDKNTLTPLNYAIQQDDAQSLYIYLRALVELSIQEGVEFNINWLLKDREDNSLLHFAGEHFSIECAKLLLNWGANKRALNKSLQTPFEHIHMFQLCGTPERRKQMFELLRPGPLSLFEQCARIVAELPTQALLPPNVLEQVKSITAQFDEVQAYRMSIEGEAQKASEEDNIANLEQNFSQLQL